MRYQELQVNLFSMSKSFVLAHCISQDCALGAGIATQFKGRNPGMVPYLVAQHPQVGQAIGYRNPVTGITTYNLVTKQKYWHKPTYETFEASIVRLKEAMVANNQTRLAIPLLGAGLDRLNWNRNRTIIQRVFKGTGISIVVCRL